MASKKFPPCYLDIICHVLCCIYFQLRSPAEGLSQKWVPLFRDHGLLHEAASITHYIPSKGGTMSERLMDETYKSSWINP